MKWSNLKINRCPKCNGDFAKTMVGGIPDQIGCKCGFRIGVQKYKEIVSDQIQSKLEEEMYADNENDMLSFNPPRSGKRQRRATLS